MRLSEYGKYQSTKFWSQNLNSTDFEGLEIRNNQRSYLLDYKNADRVQLARDRYMWLALWSKKNDQVPQHLKNFLIN